MAHAQTSTSSPEPARLPHMFGMDCPLYAMRFAEDLMKYVLEKMDYSWPPERTVGQRVRQLVQKKLFLPVVGDAVIELIANNISNITKSYKALIAMNVHNKDDFKREVCITATMSFPTGYDHESFLTFAALLIGVSLFYFAGGNTEIADASAQVLSYVLNYYIHQCMFKTSSDWFMLALAAQEIRRSIEKKEVKFTPGKIPKEE